MAELFRRRPDTRGQIMGYGQHRQQQQQLIVIRRERECLICCTNKCDATLNNNVSHKTLLKAIIILTLEPGSTESVLRVRVCVLSIERQAADRILTCTVYTVHDGAVRSMLLAGS